MNLSQKQSKTAPRIVW